jgi:hypothetical protein
MKLRYMVCALIAGVMLAPVAARAQSGELGRCANDSKLLNGGPTLVYGEGPGTWWGLVIDGLNTAGFETDEEKIGYLNQVFGSSSIVLLNPRYTTRTWLQNMDLNQNGYVCATNCEELERSQDPPL